MFVCGVAAPKFGLSVGNGDRFSDKDRGSILLFSNFRSIGPKPKLECERAVLPYICPRQSTAANVSRRRRPVHILERLPAHRFDNPHLSTKLAGLAGCWLLWLDEPAQWRYRVPVNCLAFTRRDARLPATSHCPDNSNGIGVDVRAISSDAAFPWAQFRIISEFHPIG